MRRLRARISNLFGSTWAALAILFLLLLGIALAALILSSILWGKQGCNIRICQDCNSSCDNCNSSCIECIGTCTNTTGKIFTIITDNSTNSTLNGTLVFTGECGIESFIDIDGNITYTNFRELTKYVVGTDNCSEFATPQEAYNQAILDGKGGDSGEGALIFIKPGNYDFTGSQFVVNQSGIVFYGAPWAGVYFTSTDTTSGIYTNISPTSVTSVIFNHISFGALGDTNGFLLNISSGRTILDTCYAMNSNFRMAVGKENIAFAVSYNSIFQPLPPNDFVTAEGENATVTWINTRLINEVGTQGGIVFNMAPGFGSLNLIDTVFMFTFYDGIVLGPTSITTSANFLRVDNIFMEQLSTSNSYFVKQTHSMRIDIQGSQIYIQGPIITQDTDSTNPSDVFNITLLACRLKTANASISYDVAVTEISFVNIQISNCDLVVNANDDILFIPAATAGDILNITLTSSTISTQSAPGGNYLTGPGVSFATLNLAGSVSLNGATTTTGVTNVVLPFLS